MSRGGSRGPGGHGRGMAGGKPKNAKKTLKRLLAYLGTDKVKLFFVLLFVLVSGVTMLAGSYLLRPIINNLAANYSRLKGMSGAGADDFLATAVTALTQSVLVLAGVYFLGIASMYLQQRIMVGISQRAVARLRKDLFDHIQELPLRYFDTNNTGEVMSRFTNDVDAIGEMLNNTVVQIFSGAISIVGTLALMLYTNIWLSLVTIIMVPIMVKACSSIGKRSGKYYAAQQAAIGDVNGYIEETVTGQKVVKVFCHEEKAIEEFAEKNDDLKGKQIRAQFFGFIMMPVMGNMSQISYALTTGIGALLCVNGGFDVGGLTVFVNFSRQFARPINEIAMQVNTIFAALAGAERVFATMDEQVEVKDREGAVELQNVNGEVKLNHVTFGYNPDKVILKDIDIEVVPGKKIAFVGSTGAGKTTITNLLNRFYDIQEGSISVDGMNILDIKRDSLRKNIAMVLQDTHLFTGPVRENIRYGRPDATDEEVEEAAKVASAHSFIMRLEDGYDTVLEGDGTNLSQGQRQLLNIARASISKAPILVLDEATSSVDTRTERHIEHGMERLMKNRTTFIIAHRLSTVRNADCIIVLEHGEIMERGNHQELLGKKGRYYQLYTGTVELD